MAKTNNRKNSSSNTAVLEKEPEASTEVTDNLSEQQVAVLNEGNTSDDIGVAELPSEEAKEGEVKEPPFAGATVAATNAKLKAEAEASGKASTVSKDAQEILAYYKPRHVTLDDIRANMQEQVTSLAKSDNEAQGNIFVNMCLDMCDLGALLLGKGSLAVSKAMDRSLWAHIVNDKLLGEVVEEKDDVTGAVIARHDVYKDRAPYAVLASRAACLVLEGYKTGVTVGYIRKDEVSGRRFSKKMTFLSASEIDPEQEYWQAICVPQNVVVPHAYRLTYDAINETHSLMPEGKSNETTLRYLAPDWINALYEHFFQGYVLQVELEGKGKRLPTGMVTGTIDPAKKTDAKTSAAGTQTRDTGGSTKAGETENKDQQVSRLQRELAIERDKTADSRTSVLRAILNEARDVSRPYTDTDKVVVGELACAVFRKRVVNGKAPSKEVMRPWIALFADMQVALEFGEASEDGKEDDSEKVYLLDSTGTRIAEYVNE